MFSKLIYSVYILVRYAVHSFFASVVVMMARQMPDFRENGISLRFQSLDLIIALSVVFVAYALYAFYLKNRLDRATLSTATSKEFMEHWNLRPPGKMQGIFDEVKKKTGIEKYVRLFIVEEFDIKLDDDGKQIKKKNEKASEFAYGNMVCLKDTTSGYTDDEIKGVIAHELGHIKSLTPLKLFYDRVTNLDLTDGGLGVVFNGIFEMAFTVVVSIFVIIAILIVPALLMKFSTSMLVEFLAFLLGMIELFVLLRFMKKYKTKGKDGKDGQTFKEIFVAFANDIQETIKDYFYLLFRDMWLNIARRRNEIEADRFACKIGYGKGLLDYLKNEKNDNSEKKHSRLFAYLSSTHPSAQKRIKLIEEHIKTMPQCDKEDQPHERI